MSKISKQQRHADDSRDTGKKRNRTSISMNGDADPAISWSIIEPLRSAAQLIGAHLPELGLIALNQRKEVVRGRAAECRACTPPSELTARIESRQESVLAMLDFLSSDPSTAASDVLLGVGIQFDEDTLEDHLRLCK
jgi:hypothetical protein